MLSCQEVSERASALIDKELPLWDVMQMRLHLAMCKGCSAFVRQMRITRSLTAVPPPGSTDEDDAAMAAILARLHDEKPRGH